MPVVALSYKQSRTLRCMVGWQSIHLAAALLFFLLTHLLILYVLQRRMLSWEAATERLLNASRVTVGEARMRRRALDDMAYVFHYHLVQDNRWDMVSKLLQRRSNIRTNTVLDFIRGDE